MLEMDQSEFDDLLDRLTDNIDELGNTIYPLSEHALATSANRLPLLDQAKAHVLVVYALESVIFSHLRLTGIDAKQHPVFRELRRARQYFEKVKAAEDGSKGPNMRLDKDAAGRFIRNALAITDHKFKKEGPVPSTSVFRDPGRLKRGMQEAEDPLIPSTPSTIAAFHPLETSQIHQSGEKPKQKNKKRKPSQE